MSINIIALYWSVKYWYCFVRSVPQVKKKKKILILPEIQCFPVPCSVCSSIVSALPNLPLWTTKHLLPYVMEIRRGRV